MRVLLFAEPYPIRNSMIHFKDIARRFGNLIDEKVPVDFRLYANKETLDAIPAPEFARIKPSVLVPTPEEQDLYLSSLVDWDEEGLGQWRDMMLGDGAADDYVQALQSIWRRFPFDVIVHWGENGAIRRFCSENSAIEVAAELGCTRPPFFDGCILDLFGTNGAGLLPKLSIEDIEEVVGDGLSAEAALLAYSENLESAGYERQFSPLGDNLAAIISDHRGKVAFLPLQLYDDANLLLFSKYETIQDVVLDVVPRLVDEGFLVLIKPHPASKFRGSAIRENAIARAALSPWKHKIVWCDPDKGYFDNSSLMSVADLVVTVNSSVGFEASYYDKPVVVLGEAVYKPSGLFPTLDQALSSSFDLERYRHGLGLLRRFMLESYLVPATTFNNPALFYARLGALIGISREKLSPKLIASRYVELFATFQRTHFFTAMVAGLSRPGVADFAVGVSASGSLTAVPGLGLSINQARVLKALMEATGLTSKIALSENLRARWRDADFRSNLLESAGLFDAGHYLSQNADVAEAGLKPLRHFVLYGEREGRSPHPDIDLMEFQRTSAGATDYILLNILLTVISDSNLRDEDEAGDLDESAAPHESSVGNYPLSRAERQLISAAKATLRARLAQSTRRIAVVAHLYYRDIVPEILDQLGFIEREFDFIVTLPDWGTDAIERAVKERYPDAIICHLPNRGRDIGPFMEVLPFLIEKGYDAVLKLQTKRGYYVAGKLKPSMGRLWRKIALGSLLGTTAQVDHVLEGFEALPGLNIVGPAPFLLSLSEYPYHDRGKLASRYLNKLAPHSGFFAGTMFWFRPNAFAPLVKGKEAISMRSFDPDNSQSDGQIAHLVERLFGHLSGQSRFGVATTDLKEGEFSFVVGAVPADLSIHKYLAREMGALKGKGARALIW